MFLLNFFIPLLAITFYMLASSCQVNRIATGKAFPRLLRFFALLALFFHALMLYLWIDSGTGQNLSLGNMISQICWLGSVLLWFSMFYWSLDNLVLVVFPASVLSIVLMLLFPGQHIVRTLDQPWQLVHILLFIWVAGFFVIAVVQAGLVALQNYYLKQRRNLFLLKNLPALEQTESILFQMLACGFVFLSIMILISFFSYHLSHQVFSKHVALALLAWIIFAILLAGRYCLGWRGKKAMWLIYSGFSVLILCYIVAIKFF